MAQIITLYVETESTNLLMNSVHKPKTRLISLSVLGL